ncbi:MAG: 3-oxoacyl-ACP synthase [Bacteroidetes bacterium]|nr:3-oxoacyl-ACP synthase [Bacteroidota bacterium]
MKLLITSYCHIHDYKVLVNDRLIFYQENSSKFADFAKSLFKQCQITYPRFYKMDTLSKLGFLSTELILREKTIAGYNLEKVGVVFANASSSLETDLAHQETIRNRSGYFPSPSVFVYTLPNIVIGEVCIRHQIKGENAFLISETFDAGLICNYVNELFDNEGIDACICGWVEAMGSQFESLVMLVEKSAGNLPSDGIINLPHKTFNIENVTLILKPN